MGRAAVSPTFYSPKGLEALSPNSGGFSLKWNSASGFLNKSLSFEIATSASHFYCALSSIQHLTDSHGTPGGVETARASPNGQENVATQLRGSGLGRCSGTGLSKELQAPRGGNVLCRWVG